jgi:hypothetical protein
MSAGKTHRNVNDFLQYLKGVLSNRERHFFERDLESDPFAKEALEGLEKISPEQAEEDLLDLHARLRERLAGKGPARKRLSRKRRIAIYSAAAVIASLLIVGTVFLRLYDFNPEKAEKSLYEREYPAVTPEEKETPVQAEAPAGKEALQAETAPEEKTPARTPMEQTPTKKEAPAGQENRVVHEEAAPAEPGAGIREQEKTGAAVQEHGKVPAEKGKASEIKPETVTAEERVSQEQQVEKAARKSLTPVSQPVAMKQDTRQQAAVPQEMKLDTPLQEAVRQEIQLEAESLQDMQPHLAGKKALPEEEGKGEVEVLRSNAVPSGGFEAFKSYVKKHLEFPPEDTVTEKAVVVLQFTVTPEGEIRNIHALRTPGEAFTRQADLLLIEGPSWDPATDRERKIEDRVRLRFVFRR